MEWGRNTVFYLEVVFYQGDVNNSCDYIISSPIQISDY